MSAVPENLDKGMQTHGAPRATAAANPKHPNGVNKSYDSKKTVLQRHQEFWDMDQDGVIWPSDTFVGFNRLGFPAVLSVIAVLVIHGTFSYWSGDSWIPHLGFPIKLKNAHKTKHGSDSETYDTEGRFVPEKFEEVFSKYDKGNKGGLTLAEIRSMTRGNRNIMDPIGWIAEWLEWNVSYYLCAMNTSKGKMLLKDDALAIIDGTMFPKIAREIEAGRLHRPSMFKAGLVPVAGGGAAASKKKK